MVVVQNAYEDTFYKEVQVLGSNPDLTFIFSRVYSIISFFSTVPSS